MRSGSLSPFEHCGIFSYNCLASDCAASHWLSINVSYRHRWQIFERQLNERAHAENQFQENAAFAGLTGYADRETVERDSYGLA
jgi:hypothetical protein